MENTSSAKTLLLEQRLFFQNSSTTSVGLKVAAAITIIYAGVAALLNANGNLISALTQFGMILISWLVVTGVFFVCINKLGHTPSSFRSIAEVTGYGSLPLLIGTILTGIVTLTTGGFSNELTTVMDFAVLLWCIPIWVYGLSAVSGLPVRNVFILIALPILAMVILELWSLFADSGTPSAATSSSGFGAGGMGMTGGNMGGGGMSGGPGPR